MQSPPPVRETSNCEKPGRPGGLSLAVVANSLPLALAILWCLVNAAVFSIPLFYATFAPSAPAPPPSPAEDGIAAGHTAVNALQGGAVGIYTVACLALVTLAACSAAVACIGLGRGANVMLARFQGTVPC